MRMSLVSGLRAACSVNMRFRVCKLVMPLEILEHFFDRTGIDPNNNALDILDKSFLSQAP